MKNRQVRGKASTVFKTHVENKLSGPTCKDHFKSAEFLEIPYLRNDGLSLILEIVFQEKGITFFFA